MVPGLIISRKASAGLAKNDPILDVFAGSCHIPLRLASFSFSFFFSFSGSDFSTKGEREGEREREREREVS
jgi:hypothetical protein